MIRKQTSLSLVLWVLLFITGQWLNLYWPHLNSGSLPQSTLSGEKGTKEASSTTWHLFSTENPQRDGSPPCQSLLSWSIEGDRRRVLRKKLTMGAGERRWSVGHRIPLISEKLCYVTSNKQKWRRAECSVAIDDDRHIYRRKTIMKEGQEGERNPRKKIIGQWDKHEEVSQDKKEKYLEPVRERRAGPKDWRRRGPWWREEGKREE